ncbi:MAG: hypothetical protein M1370_02440 [Bacteroidetes bacterium]|nr:hypothetical protein [Bacteroidota bacterium]
MELTSARYEVDDPGEAIEFCYRQGWTDGLPVVPPTEEAVRQMLEYAGREPQEIIGAIPVRRRVVTAEKVAINAVMAGCLPAYFPVVLAVMEAALQVPNQVHSWAASTSGMAPLIIVNGPVRQEIGLNSGGNAFGPGWRANATIGRAIRLILMNVCGAVPHVLDRSTLGHPGKYAYCIAEAEERSPWEPLHVERGFEAEASTVTLIAAEGPRQVGDRLNHTAEGILRTIADTMVSLGTSNMRRQGEYVVVLGLEHVATIAASGWSKQQVKEYLFWNAVRSRADLKRYGVLPGEIEPEDRQAMVHPVGKPDDIIVIVAGGGGGRFSACIPTFGLPSVTRVIGACTECK